VVGSKASEYRIRHHHSQRNHVSRLNEERHQNMSGERNKHAATIPPPAPPLPPAGTDNDVYGACKQRGGFTTTSTARFNSWLIEQGGLDFIRRTGSAFVVSSGCCDILRPHRLPRSIENRRARRQTAGNSSVHYELAVSKQGVEEACAAGRFVHCICRSAQQLTLLPGIPRRPPRSTGRSLLSEDQPQRVRQGRRWNTSIQ